MKNEMALDAALSGALNAIKENSPATDAIVIVVNRVTGEFKFAGMPYDIHRNIDVLERALSRFKRTAAREGRIRQSIILPSTH